MNLSISNIAWESADDNEIFTLIKEQGYRGIEIAPTRIIADAPYDHVSDAVLWYEKLKKEHGFTIASMQSIWFGKTENIFGTEAERSELVAYTKKAIEFASALNCGNLVFGCPKNRSIRKRTDLKTGIAFFEELGEFAAKYGTVIGIEANPEIYNTNYIISTKEAIELIRTVQSDGIKLNLDLGTMIYNEEDIRVLYNNVDLINHVHISEPYLNPVQPRKLHRELLKLLKDEGYNRFVSIEMKKENDLSEIKKTIYYVTEVFG